MSYDTKMNSLAVAFSPEQLTNLRTRKKHYLMLLPDLPGYCITQPQTLLRSGSNKN